MLSRGSHEVKGRVRQGCEREAFQRVNSKGTCPWKETVGMFPKHDKWNSVGQEKGGESYVQVGAIHGHGKDVDQTILMVLGNHWKIYSMEEIWFNLF